MLITCLKSVREGHRIRHYGLFACTGRAANIARLRELLGPPGRPQVPVKKARRKKHDPAAMPLLRRAHDRHRDLRTRNAAAIARSIPGCHPDRHVMSWNLPLDRTVPPPLTAGSQAAKPSLCLRRLPSANNGQTAAPEASSPPTRMQIPRNEPHGARNAHVPPTLRLPSYLNPHRSQTLPAVSFIDGFQTPAGLERTRAHSCGRHLKPITKTDLSLLGRDVSC